jgi:hypothetical protein
LLEKENCVRAFVGLNWLLEAYIRSLLDLATLNWCGFEAKKSNYIFDVLLNKF